MSLLDLNSGKSNSPRLKRGVKLWVGAGFVAAVVGIGSTLASSITINGGTDTEFGQGVQKTVYCGSEAQLLKVIPISSYKNKAGSSEPAGTFFLTGIKVTDIPTACDGVNFVISMYNTLADSSPLTLASSVSPLTALTLTTPTVYWRNTIKTATETSQGPSASSASGAAVDCQKYNGVSKISSDGSGALLSASRTSFSNPCSVAYLTVKSNAFQINFKTGSSITNSDVSTAGRIVIETQEDTFGYLNTKAKGVSGDYGLAYEGLN